ncbi:MAG: transmembrane ion channel [Cytophagales bacterium CG12_big_fil_rev_8_21_14_0_65_40_12]|nr:MAG: transmembrane ion channel [Cytophagales bacterium CG12_big_fil_rev_8_21_14_0_65_40_12]PIW04583.1 MAG: transmembrane ion channel [Cytophagales bacterium CG17_big_fil_post_rev_8_21_14_2_50_40_13]
MMKIVFGFLLLILSYSGINAQVSADSIPLRPTGFPVIAKDTLFYLNIGIGPYSAEQRANQINNKIADFLTNESLLVDSLHIVKSARINDIKCGDYLLMSIGMDDANALGLSLDRTSDYYFQLLKTGLDKTAPFSFRLLIINIVIAILILAAFLFGLKYYNRFFRAVYTKIEAQKGNRIKGINLKNYELLKPEVETSIFIYIAKGLRVAVLVLIVYLLLPTVFSLFPWTQGIANTLFHYIVTPLKAIGQGLVDYLPNLLTIIVTVVITNYFLKLIKFFKMEIEKGNLVIPGFHADWSKPTYNILKAIILALVLIGIFPLLPFGNSESFKGISAFFGILIAFGGASAISNVIAGILVTYMRSFKIGDRVRIGDVVGDVQEKSLLNTRIKTIKNEIITIPNSNLLTSNTMNYTTANDEDGLILHTTVTIGYDVPWREVHKLLIDAGLKTEYIKKLPKPYVLQTSLDDFYVSYQLNVRTRDIDKMARIYSELHQNIQDGFNEAGVEIMSPHYGAHRDGNQSTIPANHLPTDYIAPWFRVKKD